MWALTRSAHAAILDFQPPEQGNAFMVVYKPLNLWYSVPAALMD